MNGKKKAYTKYNLLHSIQMMGKYFSLVSVLG